MNFTYVAVQTHLTPSYRLFSTQDATLVCCFGAPRLSGIGHRHRSMPSTKAENYSQFSRLALTVTLLRTSLSNRTGRGTSHVKGAVYLAD